MKINIRRLFGILGFAYVAFQLLMTPSPSGVASMRGAKLLEQKKTEEIGSIDGETRLLMAVADSRGRRVKELNQLMITHLGIILLMASLLTYSGSRSRRRRQPI